MKKMLLLFGILAVAASAIACGEQAATPAAPSPAASSGTAAAAADGSTLKASAPAPYSPANGSIQSTLTPNLVVANSTLTHLGDVPLASKLFYRFVVETTSGAVVVNMLAPTTEGGYAQLGITGSRVPENLLQSDTAYRWRARAEMDGAFGPWSGYWTFTTQKSAASLPSYQNATELFDNLTDGKTIGTLVGGARLVVGKGVYLPAFESHVTYTLQSTLTSGSIECLIEGISLDTNGGKTKVFSSQQGYSDITDNPFRFTIEKRGDDHPDVGKYRIRIITGNSTSGFYDSDRIQPASLVASKTYYHRVTWGSNLVSFVVRDTSSTGPVVASYEFSYQGTYRPSPHVVHIGAPVPRGGALDATVPGITVRYFYVSQGGRWPGFADVASALGLSGPGQ
jgi:hypothetical protein